jgi:hypothetical protein
MTIAEGAAEGKILQRRAPEVLPRENVVQDEMQFGERLRELAIFARATCALPDRLPQRLW